MKKLIIVSAALVATAGLAQTGSSGGSSDAEGPDPNATICRIINETGSRLARSRVCMTRAEWEQQRRDLRQNVERSQLRRIEKESQ